MGYRTSTGRYVYAAFIVLIAASILRFVLAGFHHVSGDACWHVSVGKFIGETGIIPFNEGLGRSEPFWAPPLFHLITALVYTLVSTISDSFANIAIQFISPLFGSLTLFVTWLICRRLFGIRAAFYSVLFLAFLPLHIDYSVFMYVEGLLTFLIVTSVYFALRNKTIISGVFFGLALLTKYNAAFIFPTLAFIVFMNNRTSFKRFFSRIVGLGSVAGFIWLPWLVRNFRLLGNPVWPFVNFLFKGLEQASYSGFDLLRMAHVNTPVFFYLGMFGIPDGNPQHLFSFSFPFAWIFILGWICATGLFLFWGLGGSFTGRKKKSFLIVWIVSYVGLLIMYVSNASWASTRIVLPVFPALALLWGYGFDRFEQRKWFTHVRMYVLVVLVLICAGFVVFESGKVLYAANAWDFYAEDFSWIRTNTDSSARVFADGQCISYNVDRLTVRPPFSFREADVAFVNQRFTLDARMILDENIVSDIREHDLVYENPRTGTEIYDIS